MTLAVRKLRFEQWRKADFEDALSECVLIEDYGMKGRPLPGCEESKPRKCPLCGGKTADGVTIVPFFLENRIVVVRDVPAEICQDCGESYMKSSVVGRVEKLLDRLEDLHSEMSVIYYRVA